MNAANRLLEALRTWVMSPKCGDMVEGMLMEAFAEYAGCRALYSSAHAIGDRVSVVYPDEKHPFYEDFTGVVVGVEFHADGVDYRVRGDGDPDYTVVEASFVYPDVFRGVVTGKRSAMEEEMATARDIVWPQTVKPIVIPGAELATGHMTSDEANALVRRAMRDSYCPRDSSVTIADEARAFDPFDASFTDEERRGGERALDLFADMLEARSVETRPLCPSRREGPLSYMCEGNAGHTGPHHALNGTVTW